MSSYECKECSFKCNKKTIYNKHIKSEDHKKILESINENSNITIKKEDKINEGYNREEVLAMVKREYIEDSLFMLPFNVEGDDIDIIDAMLLVYFEITKNKNTEYEDNKYKCIVKHNLCRTIGLLESRRIIKSNNEKTEDKLKELQGILSYMYNDLCEHKQLINKLEKENDKLKDENEALRIHQNIPDPDMYQSMS